LKLNKDAVKSFFGSGIAITKVGNDTTSKLGGE